MKCFRECAEAGSLNIETAYTAGCSTIRQIKEESIELSYQYPVTIHGFEYIPLKTKGHVVFTKIIAFYIPEEKDDDDCLPDSPSGWIAVDIDKVGLELEADHDPHWRSPFYELEHPVTTLKFKLIFENLQFYTRETETETETDKHKSSLPHPSKKLQKQKGKRALDCINIQILTGPLVYAAKDPILKFTAPVSSDGKRIIMTVTTNNPFIQERRTFFDHKEQKHLILCRCPHCRNDPDLLLKSWFQYTPEQGLLFFTEEYHPRYHGPTRNPKDPGRLSKKIALVRDSQEDIVVRGKPSKGIKIYW
jgi:hypothetical protein